MFRLPFVVVWAITRCRARSVLQFLIRWIVRGRIRLKPAVEETRVGTAPLAVPQWLNTWNRVVLESEG